LLSFGNEATICDIFRLKVVDIIIHENNSLR